MYKIITWVALIKNAEVLLLKKPDNSEWTLIGGHVEDNESSKMSAVRRTAEEIGVTINKDDLDLLCIMDRQLDNAYKLHVFFQGSQWQGAIENKEPNVHSEVKWFKLNDLPANISPLASSAIESMSTKKLYYFKDHLDIHNKH
jgi:8-oxo-dGTP diphosphatase